MKKVILSLALSVLFALVAAPSSTSAYGECSKYGLMATYNSYNGTCTCMSGYMMGDGVLGQPYCISYESYCDDKYGYSSRYNILYDRCECGYGYVMAKSITGSLRCVSGTTECHDKHGYNSDYQDYSKSCVCNSGYTFDSSDQCVKKQNNVYFTVKQLNTDNREAVIKSNYDYRYYHIKYGIGCYPSSFRGYLRSNIVINLGTDYELDTWDMIVLQNSSETCNITYRERVYSDYTLPVESAPIFAPTRATGCPANSYLNGSTCTCNSGYIADSTKTYCVKDQTPTPTSKPSVAPGNTPPSAACDAGYGLSLDKMRCLRIPSNAHAVSDGKNVWLCDDGFQEKGNECVLSNIGTPTPRPSNTPSSWSWGRLLKFWEWFK